MPRSCSAPCSPRMVRLSNLLITWYADAGWEVGLDGAGDDVHRGALGRHDHVDAGGAGHLGEALHRGLDSPCRRPS